MAVLANGNLECIQYAVSVSNITRIINREI
jgi:hypothetical protein